MRSLKELSDYLRELEYINDDAFESWAEKGEIEYSGSAVTQGFEPVNLFFRLPYQAVFSWENWHGDAYALFGDIIRWLIERGYDFDEHGMPAFDAELLDDETTDLEITIKFCDEVYSKPLIPGQPIELVEKPQPAAVEDATVCDGALPELTGV